MRVGISKVIAMRSKIVPGHFCYFFSIVVEFMPSASVFNMSLGTWQTLMHGKSCLIPILSDAEFCRQYSFWHLGILAASITKDTV